MNIPDLQSVIQALGWTLVHFLWQGAAIGIVFGLVMRVAGNASSRFRYRSALALFLSAGVAPVVTFWMVFESSAGAAAPLGGVLAVSGAAPGGVGATPWWLALEHALDPYLPWAVALWLAGVIVMSGRVCLDWWQVRRLTWVGVSPLPAQWESRVADLVRTFGVSRPVRVLRSTVVRVPAVIGWLRPVVLLPTAALAGLSARQLELIIAHELVHIRRADYLVNLLQVAIETVLFYHPAVRWMSNRLRQERELCCDDAVIGTCGDTLTYAHALTELEAQRQQSFQTALAASGGYLSQRIYRMLDRPLPRRNTLIWGMSLVVGLAAGSMALAAQFALTSATVPGPATRTESELLAPARTLEQPPGTADGAARAANEPAAAESPRARTPVADRSEGLEPAPVIRADDPPAGRRAAATDPTPDPSRVAAANAGSEPNGGNTGAEPVTPAPEAASRPAVPDPADAGPGPDDSPDPVREAESGPVGKAETAPPAPAEATVARAGDGPEAAVTPAEETPTREPIQVARANRPDSKAAAPPEPQVRGGEPLHVAAPEYPRRARLRGLQGSVTAVFTIDRDGRVANIEIADSSPAGVFDRAVTEALAEWRFRPLTRDGEPVARRVSKAFEFNLAGGRARASESADTCDPVTGTRICRPWSAAPGVDTVQ